MAIDYIFANEDELSSIELSASTDAQSSSKNDLVRDGSEKYKLFALISHMGNSTTCGHYVSHVLKYDRWVIFNDDKVAISENPPKDLAYLYLYKRL